MAGKTVGFDLASAQKIVRTVRQVQGAGGRTTKTPHKRRRGGGGGGGGTTRAVAMIVANVTGATYDATTTTVTAGTSADGAARILSRTSTGMEWDSGSTTLPVWNEVSQSTIRGSTTAPVVLPGEITDIDGVTYFVPDQFDLASLSGFVKGSDTTDDAQGIYHEGNSNEFKIGRDDCEEV
ncbi:MAG: hypothetical protein KDA57_17730 [Planctomycetales bacterium]|nr:hypothetical protein [Planctomycetales bacterium]